MVVAGIGAVPDTELAEGAGLPVDDGVRRSLEMEPEAGQCLVREPDWGFVVSIKSLVAASSLVASSGVLLLLLTGCGGSATEPSAPPSPSEVAAAVSSDLLLAPQQMPEWNGAIQWEEAGAAAGPAVELCPWPSPDDLGAVATAERAFVAAGGSMAGRHVVMAFESEPDAAAANTALQAALVDCGGSVISQPGTAMTWTTSELVGGTSDDATFEFVGVDSVADHVTVVEFSLIGQDANWEQDPLVASLEASSDLLANAQ